MLSAFLLLPSLQLLLLLEQPLSATRFSPAIFLPQSEFYAQVSHESGFVVSSSSQEANSVNEDPMVQQMNNLRGYIQQAREANMFDEVSMLESNLRMLQEEFKRQKEEEAVAAAKQQVTDMSLEEASNPFSQVQTNSGIVAHFL